MCPSNVSRRYFRVPSLVATLSEVLSGQNNLYSHAIAFKLSVHLLGDTLNKKFFGMLSILLNQLSWSFLALKMTAKSKNVPSVQIQQITVANSHDPSYSVWPLRKFNSGRCAGKNLPFLSRGCRIISITQRDCVWPITKPVSSVLYVFSTSILCSVAKTMSYFLKIAILATI